MRPGGLQALQIGLVVAALAVPTAPAHAARGKGKPTQIVPTKNTGKARRFDRRADVDRSEGGTRRGALELTLGSVVLASGGMLIGRGIWELVASNKLADECAAGIVDSIECDLVDPRRHGRIAAGLSFGLAGVMGLAGGFLLARGLRIHRDYLDFQRQSKATARLSLAPWASVRRPAAGVSVRVRF